MRFAVEKLKIEAHMSDYAACHRLSQEPNAGVIMRFKDLSQRNAWVNGAKNLKNQPNCKNFSISPDLPNDLRPLKTELLNKRKSLPFEQKRESNIRYLRQWPYVELRIKHQPTIRPSESVANVCERVLGLPANSLILSCQDPTVPPEEEDDDGDDDEGDDHDGDDDEGNDDEDS